MDNSQKEHWVKQSDGKQSEEHWLEQSDGKQSQRTLVKQHHTVQKEG